MLRIGVRARGIAAAVSLFLFGLLAGPSIAPAAITTAVAPVALDRGWEFKPAVKGAGTPSRPLSNETRGWRAVKLPHVFANRPKDADYLGGAGWYRLRFKGPNTLPDHGWDFQFDRVRLKARAWLNGKPLKLSNTPYVPFRSAARGLRTGGLRNTLMVYVSNLRPPDLRECCWNWGGLSRPVSLVSRPPIALRDAALVPEVNCQAPGQCAAAMIADGWAVNRGTQAVDARVAASLESPTGKPVQAEELVASLQPGEVRRVRFKIPIAAPELWSPDKPQRYTGALGIAIGDVAIDATPLKVGLRSVKVEDGMLELNGRRLQLRGAGLVEDMPGRGDALRDIDLDRIVRDLKALGANVTRAHYLLDPRLLEKLDAAGIMVWSEAMVYHADEDLKTAAGRRKHLATVRGTVLEARRHPSVITHAAGDELDEEPDDGEYAGTGVFLREAAALIKDLDPSVPASIALLSYPNIAKQSSYDDYPLLGLNTYYGWYRGKKGARSTADFAGLEPYLASMRRKYPGKALVIAEFGAEARFGGSASKKGTYAFQADYVRKTLDVADRTSFLSGAIYWTLREFLVKPDWTGGAPRGPRGRTRVHAKGLIAYDGRRKPAFGVARNSFVAALARAQAAAD